ncbi:hypothetical protein K438DRAFT_1784140 [Mycena galopus ATCC 62051]|nr:hypothetical protein K438DRAFT_1784140 [Mycena galopus ATCC 62051]
MPHPAYERKLTPHATAVQYPSLTEGCRMAMRSLSPQLSTPHYGIFAVTCEFFMFTQHNLNRSPFVWIRFRPAHVIHGYLEFTHGYVYEHPHSISQMAFNLKNITLAWYISAQLRFRAPRLDIEQVLVSSSAGLALNDTLGLVLLMDAKAFRYRITQIFLTKDVSVQWTGRLQMVVSLRENRMWEGGPKLRRRRPREVASRTKWKRWSPSTAPIGIIATIPQARGSKGNVYGPDLRCTKEGVLERWKIVHSSKEKDACPFKLDVWNDQAEELYRNNPTDSWLCLPQKMIKICSGIRPFQSDEESETPPSQISWNCLAKFHFNMCKTHRDMSELVVKIENCPKEQFSRLCLQYSP